MKNILLILIWVIVLCSGALASGYIQDGLCKVFLGQENGFLFILENQHDIVRDGAVFQFYETGEVEKMAWYRNGEKEGTSRLFWSDGQLRSLLKYRSGLLHGQVYHYDRQGRPQMEFIYSNGFLTGIGYYNEEGVFKNRVRYENGTAVEIFDNEPE